MITQEVQDQFLKIFKPNSSEIAAHPIELISLTNNNSWGIICQQIRHRNAPIFRGIGVNNE